MLLSGLLLVGGASERFGSPKALARFRGETLAERSLRLLAEACDEVLAVGKPEDELPFEVIDDGTSERAPVHGLIAGLRQARHDVVVALPLDVPLVTPGALRALGDAGAVPGARIPLPGAYPRSLLPELERRVAEGELSLRGVNPTTLALPEGLLADADTPEALACLARPGHAVVVGGTELLAGLTGALAERGHPVTSIARREAESDPAVTSAPVDYRDSGKLTAALARAVAERGPIELAVCRIHADALDAPRIVADGLAPGGRLVHVLGERDRPLEGVPLHVAYRRVLVDAVDERTREHEEISAGVLAAIDADRPTHVIGTRAP